LIVCICRGKSEREVRKALDAGASTVRDLQRCGIGDQCGSCHISLRSMLGAHASASACSAAAANAAHPPHPHIDAVHA